MEVNSNLNFKQYLGTLRGRTIYYRPNPGNGGDALIAAGTIRVFRELGMDFVLVDESMDLTDKTVLLGGGGNLTGDYDFCAGFIRKWHCKADTFILGPHTVCSNQQLLSELSGNTVLFCREKTSYDYVRSAVDRDVQVFIDHDLAFQLHPDEFTSKWPLRPSCLYLRTLVRKRFRDCRTLHVFRRDPERTDIFRPRGNIDVSTKLNYDCELNEEEPIERSTREIFFFLDFFYLIHTNRLHIAIAAYLLGKQVFFYPNSYYKNQAVYEYSLAGKENVTFCYDNQF